MFKKVLIANRGEIAIRIIRACQEMGIHTLAIYAEDDRSSRHVRLADEAHLLPGTTLADTYLNIDKIISLAKEHGAEAIHPGYGFLSENAGFSKACADAGIVFMGPSAQVIEAMGSKLKAREAMQAAGVPVTPGSPKLNTFEDCQKWAAEIGYPLLLKASAGGGGRGMKKVEAAQDLQSAFESAQREGKTYFGDDTIYLEKWVQNPRHIEIQIMADSHGQVFHLGERDCSVQRRNQKLIEETPAPNLPQSVKDALYEAAVKGAQAIGYVGAGTFEFVVQNNSEPYFMEVNTRLQVEHPVTEMVTQRDLVKAQLRVAFGEKLDWKQADIVPRGHAIECRITCEDAHQNFRPVPGKIQNYVEPQGFGVRVDSMPYAGYEVPKSYDSLLAKLITWAPTRDEAIGRMKRALKEYEITGVTTLLDFHHWAMSHEAFASGDFNTGFVADYFTPDQLPEKAPESPADDDSAQPEKQTFDVEVNGKFFQVAMYLPEGGGSPQARSGLKKPKKSKKEQSNTNPNQVTTPMSGTVVKVKAQAGQDVTKGQVLVVIESMKMENDILSPKDGKIKAVLVEAAQSVQSNALLVEFEA